MNKACNLISIVFHPVFISVLVVFGYLGMYIPTDDYKWLLFPVWVIFVNLILPGAYFKLLRSDIDVFKPNIIERSSIYKAFMLISLLLSVAFLLMQYQLGTYFLSLTLLFFLLFLLSKYHLKASWHAAGWLNFSLGMIAFYLHQPFREFLVVAGIAFLISCIVLLCRYKTNAHSIFELGMGCLVGIISIIPIFILL